MVVFLSCCDSVEFHYTLFSTVTIHRKPIFNIPLFKLHGNMGQKDRTKTYFDFCNATAGILLCTDVASRGLDLPAVNWIVQYDAPGDTKEYLHRIGRTARLGHKGEAVIFLQPHEMLYTRMLEKYELNLQQIKGETILEHLIVEFQSKTIRDPIEAATWLQNVFEGEVFKSTDMKKQAIAAYQSHIRYYSTHSKDVKYIFHVKNLHLGHLAKSFGLKEKPTDVRGRQEILGGTNYAVEKQKRMEQYDRRRTDTRVVSVSDQNVYSNYV
jgi:ATP-dependent RNA helicase DDX31/DBP7